MTVCVWILFNYGRIVLINLIDTVMKAVFGGLGPELTMAVRGITMISFILTAVAARIGHNLE